MYDKLIKHADSVSRTAVAPAKRRENQGVFPSSQDKGPQVTHACTWCASKKQTCKPEVAWVQPIVNPNSFQSLCIHFLQFHTANQFPSQDPSNLSWQLEELTYKVDQQ